jgi:hypothetical protein
LRRGLVRPRRWRRGRRVGYAGRTADQHAQHAAERTNTPEGASQQSRWGHEEQVLWGGV